MSLRSSFSWLSCLLVFCSGTWVCSAAFAAERMPQHMPQHMPQQKSLRQPLIVASIRPLALVAQQLVGDQAEVKTLIDGASSPHDFSLSIGQALMLSDAQLLIWVAPEFETFLTKVPASTTKLSMLDVLESDLVASQASMAHGKELSDEYRHSSWHLWLSSKKMLLFAEALAAHLQQTSWIDPVQLAARLARLQEEVAQARGEIYTALQAYQKRPFAVFHDAFGEFVDEFKLTQNTSLTRVPHQRIGAKQLVEHNDKLQQAACMLVDLAEKPVAQRYARMFDLPLVDVDLLAAGPELSTYAAYLKSIANSFQQCFDARTMPTGVNLD